MRYTNKPTQQVLAKLKSRYKKKHGGEKMNARETKTNNLSESKEDDALVRRNTGSSMSGIN